MKSKIFTLVLILTGLLVLCSCAKNNESGDETVATGVDAVTQATEEDAVTFPQETTQKQETTQAQETGSTQAATTVPAVSTTEEVTQEKTQYNDIYFDTTDIDGKPLRIEDMKDAKVIMLNLWESWCGPCVREMPDLERLYNDYKDKGLVIIGAFTTPDDEYNVRDVISYTGVTYPICKATERMSFYTTDYVPTSYFFNADGNLLINREFVGSKSYEEWEAIIKELL